jgi:hypothetical protein
MFKAVKMPMKVAIIAGYDAFPGVDETIRGGIPSVIGNRKSNR